MSEQKKIPNQYLVYDFTYEGQRHKGKVLLDEDTPNLYMMYDDHDIEITWVKRIRHKGKPPSGDEGFKWANVDPNYMDWTPHEYRDQLNGALAERQFKNDIEAMESCDACVLVLPYGRSAHTEAGWFAGQGKKVIAYIPEQVEPELMYKLFEAVCTSMEEVILNLK